MNIPNYRKPISDLVQFVLKLAVAVCLFAVAFSFLDIKGCGQDSDCPQAELVSEKIIPGDSIPYPVPVYIPEVDTFIQHDTSWRFHEVDTAAILADYFSQRIYIDSAMSQDSSILTIIQDTISENRIKARQISFQNLRPTLIQQYDLKKTRKLLIGGAISGNRTFFDPEVSIGMQDKQDRIYHYSYHPITQAHEVGVMVVVRFKR